MIHDAKTSRKRGVWVEAETLRPVRWVRWYDDRTLEYEAFRIDPVHARAAGVDLRTILYRGRARLNFFQTGEATPAAVRPPAADDPDVIRLLRTAPADAVPGKVDHGVELCDEPRCYRPAAYKVADEVEVPPAAGPDGRLYDRGAVPRRRKYCAGHYRKPTRTTLRGVTNEVEVVMGRPQWER